MHEPGQCSWRPAMPTVKWEQALNAPGELMSARLSWLLTCGHRLQHWASDSDHTIRSVSSSLQSERSQRRRVAAMQTIGCRPHPMQGLPAPARRPARIRRGVERPGYSNRLVGRALASSDGTEGGGGGRERLQAAFSQLGSKARMLWDALQQPTAAAAPPPAASPEPPAPGASGSVQQAGESLSVTFSSSSSMDGSGDELAAPATAATGPSQPAAASASAAASVGSSGGNADPMLLSWDAAEAGPAGAGGGGMPDGEAGWAPQLEPPQGAKPRLSKLAGALPCRALAGRHVGDRLPLQGKGDVERVLQSSCPMPSPSVPHAGNLLFTSLLAGVGVASALTAHRYAAWRRHHPLSGPPVIVGNATPAQAEAALHGSSGAAASSAEAASEPSAGEQQQQQQLESDEGWDSAPASHAAVDAAQERLQPHAEDHGAAYAVPGAAVGAAGSRLHREHQQEHQEQRHHQEQQQRQQEQPQHDAGKPHQPEQVEEARSSAEHSPWAQEHQQPASPALQQQQELEQPEHSRPLSHAAASVAADEMVHK